MTSERCRLVVDIIGELNFVIMAFSFKAMLLLSRIANIVVLQSELTESINARMRPGSKVLDLQRKSCKLIVGKFSLLFVVGFSCAELLPIESNLVEFLDWKQEQYKSIISMRACD